MNQVRLWTTPKMNDEMKLGTLVYEKTENQNLTMPPLLGQFVYIWQAYYKQS